MNKTKTVAKKPKADNAKKLSARNNRSSAKPIKLGGVPNQGTLSAS